MRKARRTRKADGEEVKRVKRGAEAKPKGSKKAGKKRASKSDAVKAKIKVGANVLALVPKDVLNNVNIFELGCLVYFSFGCWGARETLSEDEMGDLPPDIVKGWKYLLSREPLREINKVGRNARQELKVVSTRFRSVKATRYVLRDYITRSYDALKTAEAAYWERVDYFINHEFEILREQRKSEYPKWYESTYYPDKQALRDKFHWDVDFMIVQPPAKEASILNVEQYRYQQERERERVRAFFNEALLVVAAKFLELTTKLREKLVNKEVFKASTLENLREFADGFDALNVTGNKELAATVAKCKKYLSGVDRKMLSDDDALASQVGKRMDSILNEVKTMHDGAFLRAIDI